MHRSIRESIGYSLLVLGIATACGPTTDELRDVLPTRGQLLVEVPEQTASSVEGLTGTTRAGLVGDAAHFYTLTYYQAREVNGLLVGVLDILEKVTSYPATIAEPDRAVWGPFSDDNEPNDFRVVVERVRGQGTEAEASTSHYRWVIEGRHKSHGDSQFVTLASGAFAPANDMRDEAQRDESAESRGVRYGRGWLAIDFEAIHALNPIEDGRGRILFAYAVTPEATSVRAHYTGPGEDPVSAGYAYGEDIAGRGFIVFAVEDDIDHGESGKVAREDLIIRARWGTEGRGRADVLAKNGDLGASVVLVSQCWDERFLSTYERVVLDATTVAEDGAAQSCRFETEEQPNEDDVPLSADEVMNPFE